MEKKITPYKKRTNKITLPATLTWLRQPNTITMMRSDYSLLQLRALFIIMGKMQNSITTSITNVKLDKRTNEAEQLQQKKKNEHIVQQQLDLFNDFRDERNEDYLRFNIALKDFNINHTNYKDLKKALKELAGIVVEIPFKDKKTGEDWLSYEGLLSAEMPKEYGKNIIIKIRRDVSKFMLETIYMGYTKFLREIIFNIQSPNTLKIYLLICKNVEFGGFRMTLENFKKYMFYKNHDKIYKNFSLLSKKVINPAYERLFENSNVWFEVIADYKSTTDKEPHCLVWKVYKVKSL
ncbi:MAG: replication initiation protein [Oscillospiraceae bacterium]|jgi:hypothetical protein|nr:replication initiation protein [Oscillospiraceae bacterium]